MVQPQILKALRAEPWRFLRTQVPGSSGLLPPYLLTYLRTLLFMDVEQTHYIQNSYAMIPALAYTQLVFYILQNGNISFLQAQMHSTPPAWCHVESSHQPCSGAQSSFKELSSWVVIKLITLSLNLNNLLLGPLEKVPSPSLCMWEIIYAAAPKYVHQ